MRKPRRTFEPDSDGTTLPEHACRVKWLRRPDHRAKSFDIEAFPVRDSRRGADRARTNQRREWWGLTSLAIWLNYQKRPRILPPGWQTGVAVNA